MAMNKTTRRVLWDRAATGEVRIAQDGDGGGVKLPDDADLPIGEPTPEDDEFVPDLRIDRKRCPEVTFFEAA
jgi:hypothetical protein